MIPGRPWTQPISAARLQQRLKTIGVAARPARTATLLQLAADVPAAVASASISATPSHGNGPPLAIGTHTQPTSPGARRVDPGAII
jgi:hypothetical protein